MTAILRVHGQGYTADHECDDEVDAEALAYLLLSRGIRMGNRIYPNTSVSFVEIIVEEDGNTN